jgi:hypothetical protein
VAHRDASCFVAAQEMHSKVDFEELRRLNDTLDWEAMTTDAIDAVQTSLKPRKQEWLVLDGKPVPGAKEKIHDGAWWEGDAALGWAAVPDTVDLPRYVDGSMLEWANINTKMPHELGYLEVRPQDGPRACNTCRLRLG